MICTLLLLPKIFEGGLGDIGEGFGMALGTVWYSKDLGGG